MPIVTIEQVADDAVVPGDLARRLADAIGEALGATPGRTWVRLRPIPRGHYAESGTSAEDTPRPIFVTVLRRAAPPAERLEAEAAALAHAVAQAMGRSADCVHVEFAPAAAGRLAFGGKLVR
jgi:phenylpyruvate tautomerase PptA (4-oxalocrotonate tautomerase family)